MCSLTTALWQVTGAVNVMSVTMVPNVNIVSPAVITITGCVSHTDDSQTLALAGDGASLFIGQAASWSRQDRTLQLQAHILKSPLYRGFVRTVLGR